jgi:hypothetical protein
MSVTTNNQRNIGSTKEILSLRQTYESCWFHRSNECYVVLNEWILILFLFWDWGIFLFLFFFNFFWLWCFAIWGFFFSFFFFFCQEISFYPRRKEDGVDKVFWSVAPVEFFRLDFRVIPWWWRWCAHHHLCLFFWALFPSYLGNWVFDNLWSGTIKNSATRIAMHINK